VARLATGTVRLARTQYHRGMTYFIAERCVAELHELPRQERDAHLAEMADVAAAIWRAFGPRKLNYEALGNTVPHLHWWLVPRHGDDPRPRRPIWEDLDFLQAQWDRGLRAGRSRARAPPGRAAGRPPGGGRPGAAVVPLS
jgi:diadenosine tetraphosphate (Ap4A) HIT family hydrolase